MHLLGADDAIEEPPFKECISVRLRSLKFCLLGGSWDLVSRL